MERVKVSVGRGESGVGMRVRDESKVGGVKAGVGRGM